MGRDSGLQHTRSRQSALLPFVGVGLAVGALVIAVTAIAARSTSFDPLDAIRATSAPREISARVPRIGYLSTFYPEWPPEAKTPRVEAFLQGLQNLGYRDGVNILIEYRFAHEHPDRVPELVAELVGLDLDLIVMGDSGVIRHARAATSTIPLVTTITVDPVAVGSAASLNRPGSNLTGMSLSGVALEGKRLELLKETLPDAQRIAVLWVKTNTAPLALKEVEAAASVLGIELLAFEVQKPDDIPAAIDAAASQDVQALYSFGTPLLNTQRRRIIELAQEHSLPVMGSTIEWVYSGGLLIYWPSYSVIYQRAATYVDKILKGASPAELPIEQATHFDLAVNLSVADKLGVNIPDSILLQATEVVR